MRTAFGQDLTAIFCLSMHRCPTGVELIGSLWRLSCGTYTKHRFVNKQVEEDVLPSLGSRGQ